MRLGRKKKSTDKVLTVKIAIPALLPPCWETYEAVLDLRGAPTRKIEGTNLVLNFWLDGTKGSLIHKARNDMVNPVTHPKDTDRWYDYIMFIDSDMAWDPNWVCELVRQSQERDLPVHSAVAVRKKHPFRPAIFAPNPKTGFLTSPAISPAVFDKIKVAQESGDREVRLDARIHEVSAVGAAFMLIRRDVIDAIKPPWFHFKWIGCGGKSVTNPDPETGFGDTGEELHFEGEDVYFCLRAREQGFKSTVDLGMWVGHVGDYVYDMADYIAAMQSRAEILAIEREGGAKNKKKLILTPIDAGADHKLLNREELGDQSGVRRPGPTLIARP